MSRADRTLFVEAALVAAAVLPAQPALATIFLSADAAQRSVFPQAQSFEEIQITLTDEQRQEIARLGGPQAGHGSLRAWAARVDQNVVGHVFIDEVVGRQDFITYAVGIDANGKLRPVEILEYRESHGGEIRNKRWLAQFNGRSTPQQLRFGTDIKNIAGATLSSEHVTAGVRRILALWQAAFAPGSAAQGKSDAPVAPSG
jgi:Na+-translocating ferredoxin:NAD+ oxidoreductase RnfG subunit